MNFKKHRPHDRRALDPCSSAAWFDRERGWRPPAGGGTGSSAGEKPPSPSEPGDCFARRLAEQMAVHSRLTLFFEPWPRETRRLVEQQLSLAGNDGAKPIV